MNPARQAQLERGLTSIARKVYECVTTDDQTLTQIIAALNDRGMRPTKDVVQGCLASLKSQGLVRERAGYFWRAAVKEKQSSMTLVDSSPVTATAPAPAPAPAPKPGVVDRLLAAASGLRVMATELDEIALAVEERGAVDTRELEKLRKLRAALQESIA